MSANLWLTALEAAQVAVLQADTDLYNAGGTGLALKVERGLLLPFRDQDIYQMERPYIGAKVLGYTADLGRVEGYAIGCSVHDVTTRLDISHAAGQQADLDQRLKEIISHLAFVVGRQRISNPFAFRTSFAHSVTLNPGGGNISRIKEPDGEIDCWIGEAEYTFTTRVRLGINHDI